MNAPTLLLLISACASPTPAPAGDTATPSDGGSADGGADSGDTGDVDAFSCVEDDAAFSLSVATPTEAVGTVLDVQWTTTTDAPAAVRYIDSTGVWQSTGYDAGGTSHSALVVGFSAYQQAELVLVSAPTDGDPICSAPIAADVGGLPPDMVELTGEQPQPDAQAGGWIVSTMFTVSGRMVVIIDSKGQYIWARSLDDDPGEGVPQPALRATLNRAHDGILVNTQSDPENPGRIYEIGYDGAISWRELADTQIDFAELPDGRLANLGHIYWQEDGGEVWRGDEILITEADGSQTSLWNVFDDMENPLPAGSTRPSAIDGPAVEEYAHGNGLHYIEDANDFIVSLQYINALARVDGETGETEWVLQPGAGTVDVSDAGQQREFIEWPHGASYRDGELTVFSRSYSDDGDCSYVSVIDIDDGGQTAALTRYIDSDPCVIVSFLGDVHHLPNGNIMAVWSASGRIDELTPDGALVSRVTASLGAAFGFATPTERLY